MRAIYPEVSLQLPGGMSVGNIWQSSQLTPSLSTSGCNRGGLYGDNQIRHWTQIAFRGLVPAAAAHAGSIALPLFFQVVATGYARRIAPALIVASDWIGVLSTKAVSFDFVPNTQPCIRNMRGLCAVIACIIIVSLSTSARQTDTQVKVSLQALWASTSGIGSG